MGRGVGGVRGHMHLAEGCPWESLLGLLHVSLLTKENI
jgi:hypothetical protein